MGTAETAPTGSALRPAQDRIVAAAVDLFAEHGVAGTSLQMIADRLGVTKAAVYHQFRTKDEIVLAAAEQGMAPLAAAIAEAEAAPDRPGAISTMLERLVDLAIDRRRMVALMRNDPVMIRLVAEHPPFVDLMDRLHDVLAGDGPDRGSPVPVAMLQAAIAGAVTDPLVAGVDDDRLRADLRDLAARLLEPPA